MAVKRRYVSKEVEASRRLLQRLRFQCSAVERWILKGFRLNQQKPKIEWLPVERYCLTADILAMIEREGKVLANRFDYLADVSEMEKITGIRVCLWLRDDNSHWDALVAIEGIQRTISSLLSGDGWAPPCFVAVVSKSAP